MKKRHLYFDTPFEDYIVKQTMSNNYGLQMPYKLESNYKMSENLPYSYFIENIIKNKKIDCLFLNIKKIIINYIQNINNPVIQEFIKDKCILIESPSSKEFIEEIFKKLNNVLISFNIYDDSLVNYKIFIMNNVKKIHIRHGNHRAKIHVKKILNYLPSSLNCLNIKRYYIIKNANINNIPNKVRIIEGYTDLLQNFTKKSKKIPHNIIMLIDNCMSSDKKEFLNKHLKKIKYKVKSAKIFFVML